MSWQNISLQILRTLINDLSDDPIYEDDILEMTLRTAASFVKQEVHLSTNYTINLNCGDISPDPSSDEEFINFTVLKAACIINGWAFQKKVAVEGIKAKCGPVEFGVSASRNALGLLEDSFCKTYEDLVNQYNWGNINNIKAVLSPFISNKFDPEGIF